MNDLTKSVFEEKPKVNWVKRIGLFLAVFVGAAVLTSCTQSFMSTADKTNVMYAYVYGQDSYVAEHPDEFKDKKPGNLELVYQTLNVNNSIPKPSKDFEEYIKAEYDYSSVLTDKGDGSFVVANFPTPVQATFSNGNSALSAPQQWIDANVFQKASDASGLADTFGKPVIDTILPGSVITPDSSETALAKYMDAFQSIKAMAVFGGFNDSGKVELWHNFNNYYVAAQSDANVGLSNLPTSKFVSTFESTVLAQANADRAGLNTSGTGGMYGQNGEKIYITNKTWGQAFTEYGFLEGLLVWPFGWLVNFFATSFSPIGTGWAELLAIICFTVIVRLFLLVFSIFTNKSQIKMTELQPEVAQLQVKYPNSQTNAEEKAALNRETMALYKKNHVKPWLSMVMMVFQFPIFICVWSALEGSATLSSGNFFGIDLTAQMSTAMLSSSLGIGTQALAIVFFVMMALAQVLTMLLPQMFQKWRTKNFVLSTKKVAKDPNSAQNMTKYMSIGMCIFMVFMGFSLPAGMTMYWFIGALMSIVQTLITEAMSTHSRHKKMKDGDPLSAMRRSQHHTEPLKSIRKSR